MDGLAGRVFQAESARSKRNPLLRAGAGRV
jgi:hypothetical protein